MLQQGVVMPSHSPWSSPVVLVEKKDGTKRFCVDYRHLNAVTKLDVFLLPRIDDTLDLLANSQFLLPWIWLPATGRLGCIQTLRRKQLPPVCMSSR